MKPKHHLASLALAIGLTGVIQSQAFANPLDDGPYLKRLENGTVQTRWVCEKPATNLPAGVSHQGVTLVGLHVYEGAFSPTEDQTTLIPPLCGYSFPVSALKNHPPTEAWDFQGVERIAVLSDVHGNYPLMQQLLQVNGVIDDQNQWAFGNGHLVINGDTFSRGGYVTEAFWLAYNLQQEAQAAGGRVHVLVGNHEAMTMNQDLRYVNDKYDNIAYSLVGEDDISLLYGPGTLFGEWMRTFPTLIRINDNLIVHGGISEAFLALNLNIPETNALIHRSLVDMTRREIDADTILNALYKGSSDGASPFWNRQLIRDDRLTQEQVDKLATHFGTERIIIGHTRLDPPEIKPLHNSRVIAIDAHIQSGKPGQILLIEGNQFWRSDRNGNLEPLAVRANRITASVSLPEGGSIGCTESLVEIGGNSLCSVSVNEGYQLTGWNQEGCDNQSLDCQVTGVQHHTDVTALVAPIAPESKNKKKSSSGSFGVGLLAPLLLLTLRRRSQRQQHHH